MDTELEDRIYLLFCTLTLKQKLLFYAKHMYGNEFKAYDQDLNFITKKNISEQYTNFVNKITQKCEKPTPLGV